MSPTVPDADERWLPVVGYEGIYEVSDHGRVRSLDRTIRHRNGHVTRRRGRVLRLSSTVSGYPQAGLRSGDRDGQRLVHRLVAEAFIGPCPEGMECRHLDGNRRNNSPSNLAWGTHAENVADQATHGTRRVGESVAQAKLTERDVRAIRQACADGEPQRSIARRYGVTQTLISRILLRKTWRHVEGP